MPRRESLTFTEQARRAQIVAAAIETLAEVGYAKASLERIARRLRISRSLISYHFDGKDEVIEQVLLTVQAGGGRFLQDALSQAEGPRQELAAFIRRNLAFIAQRRTYVTAVYAIVISTRAATASVAPELEITEPGVELVRGILERGQRAGVFRADFAPPAMTTAILQAVEGALSWAPGDPMLDRDGYADELVRLFDLATRAEAE